MLGFVTYSSLVDKQNRVKPDSIPIKINKYLPKEILHELDYLWPGDDLLVEEYEAAQEVVVHLLVAESLPHLKHVTDSNQRRYTETCVSTYHKPTSQMGQNEWMFNQHQHEKQIGYWVSEKDKCMKWLFTGQMRLRNTNQLQGTDGADTWTVQTI